MAIILAAIAWLLTYLLHSTVLLLGAFALAALGIVRSHAGRDTLWKVALIGGILTATAQVVLRLEPAAGHLAIAARPESPLVDVAGVRDIAPAAPLPAASTPAGNDFASSIGAIEPAVVPEGPVRSTRPVLSGLHISWPAMLLNIWFVGALGFGARLLVMRVLLKRRLRTRRPLDDGPLSDSLTDLCAAAGIAAPRLSVSNHLPGPIAFGREICIPARVLSRLAPSEQRAVLAHELGHVVRRDPAWLMAAALIESILFVQPLNRYARRRLRAEAEFLCDDWAAERTSGVVLARCLAEVAGWVQGHAAPAAAPGMAGHCSQLVSRVERLLDGSPSARPARWIVRALAGAFAMALVASSVPGVAAEDLHDEAVASADEVTGALDLEFAGYADPGEGWGAVRDGGRLVVLAAGYSARITGHGRLGFRQWGRALVVPHGYDVRIGGGNAVTDDQELCDKTGAVRIVAQDGDGAWEIVPVRQSNAPPYTAPSRDFQIARGDLRRALADKEADLRALRASTAELHAEVNAQTDAALNGEPDAAIDTLVRLWVRDPDAVRRAARRIARTYDRELRPQFESLGVEVGRELAPQLERLTSRLGRDLAPEFARLGAALGASILSDLAASPDAGSEDYRGKSKPKGH